MNKLRQLTESGQSEDFPVITRGAFATLWLRVSAVGIAYVVQILLAGWLGATGYGEYAYTVVALGMLMVPAFLGLNTAILRQIPTYLSDGSYDLARGFICRGYQIGLGFSFVITLSAWAMLQFVVSPEWSYHATFSVGIWGLPALVLLGLNLDLARSLSGIKSVLVLQEYVRPLLVLIISGLLYYSAGLSSGQTVAIFMLSSLIIGLLQLVRLLRLIPSELFHSTTNTQTRKWVIDSLPFMLNASFITLLAQVDIIIVGLLLGPGIAGVYVVATRLAALVSMVLDAVNMLAGPAYARLFAEGRHGEIQLLARRLAHIIFWPSLLAALLLVFLGMPLLSFYGEEFVTGYYAMLILAGAQLINASTGSVGYLVDMTGHQWTGTRVRAVSSIVNIFLALTLIPLFGFYGAALAAATTMILWNIWLYSIVSRRLGIYPSIFHAFSGS